MFFIMFLLRKRVLEGSPKGLLFWSGSVLGSYNLLLVPGSPWPRNKQQNATRRVWQFSFPVALVFQ
jgi:hypothetical protein